MVGGSNPPSATTPPSTRRGRSLSGDPLDRLARQLVDAARAVALPDGTPVILAVSGGPDSIALLHLAVRAVPTTGWSVRVAHLDHALREESGADAGFVQRVADELGVTCIVRRTDVGALARERGEGIEEAGRVARYGFLNELLAAASPATVAMTAHTLDDQAETVLLHLARGSGLAGMSGIAERVGRVVRPLLGVRRAELRAALDAAGLAYRIDPSNEDPRFARNRARAGLVPLLESLHPNAAVSLARTASLVALDDEALTGLAAAALAARRGADGWLDWRNPPADAIAARIVRLVAGPPAPSSERVAAVLRVAATGRGGRMVELGHGRRVLVRRHRLRILRS